MYVSIGARARPEGLVDLLLECHDRIRTFTKLALTVGERLDLTPEETIEGCARSERYFREALPLHIADEELSILPRLTGLRPELETALTTMHAEHARHEPILNELLLALTRVRAAPADITLREPVQTAATELLNEFTSHLASEETIIFPAIRELLSADEQTQILSELRARRVKRD